MEHKARSEADSAPLFQVPVNSNGLLSEQLAAAIDFAVMLQVVHSYLKAVTRHFVS
jgi:hypothetical protein